MAADPQQTLAEEAHQRPRAAVAAVAAGVLTILGGIISVGVFRDFPDVPLLGALRERAAGGPGEEPGLKAQQVLFYDENALALIGVSLLIALGALAVGAALAYLYRFTRARNETLPRLAIIAAIAGAVALAVGGLAQIIGVVIDASSFAGEQDQSAEVARDVLQSPVVVASLIIRQLGVFALGLAFVLIALNAMRAGLLTRFMGILGVIVGALFIIPLGSSLPIVQAFWLVALGVLFAGRWPNGVPKAWATGQAEPWPSTQQMREQRRAEMASRGSGRPAPDPSPPGDDGPAGVAHPSSKKRKRKRRS